MPNSNAQAVAFSNNKVRPLSQQMFSLYLSCKSVLQQWNSQAVSTVIPNDATVISDGAAVDGRPPITNAQATSIITRATDFVNFCEGSVGVNTTDGSKAVLNTISAVEVNGSTSL